MSENFPARTLHSIKMDILFWEDLFDLRDCASSEPSGSQPNGEASSEKVSGFQPSASAMETGTSSQTISEMQHVKSEPTKKRKAETCVEIQCPQKRFTFSKPPVLMAEKLPAEAQSLHCFFEGQNCIPVWPQYSLSNSEAVSYTHLTLPTKRIV